MTDRRHVSEEWRGTLWTEAYGRRGAGGDFNAALVMKLRTGGDTFRNNVPRVLTDQMTVFILSV